MPKEILENQEKSENQKVINQTYLANIAAEAIVTQETSEETSEPSVVLPKIHLVRRRYTSRDGKNYWEYLVPVVFNGQVQEVHFTASDRSGYESLEKLFTNGVKKLELQYDEVKQYDEHTGATRKYNTYEAVLTEESGFEWRFPLKARAASDKALMENYIRRLRFEVEKRANK